MRTTPPPQRAPLGEVGARISVRPLGWAPLWVFGSWVFASTATGLGVLEGEPSTVAVRVLLLGVLAASVLVHELGHAVVWALAGHDVRVYVSPVLGACVPTADDARLAPRSELTMVLAGPVTNVAVAGMAAVAEHHAGPEVAGLDLLAVVVEANLLLFAVNLLPVLPLDGGRVVHALLGLLPGGVASNFGRSVVASTSLVAAALTSMWAVVGGRQSSAFVVLAWGAIAVGASLWLVDPARQLLAGGRAGQLGIALAAGAALGIPLASVLRQFVSG